MLYGIYHAKQAIAKEDNCFLVEGYTDVIQMHQLGIENVVSSSGTALTPEQIRLINRLTPNITVLFDGDAAGQRASLRGIDLILEQGMNVKVCSFPEGEDPDSFSRKNTLTEVQDFLKENAKDFIQYKASLLMQEAQGDPIKKAGLVRDMVESIGKIPDVIKREIYIQECARIMDIKEAVLFNTLAQILNKGQKNIPATTKPAAGQMQVVEKKKTEKVDRQFVLERKLIELLLLYGNQKIKFDDVIVKENEDGDPVEEPIVFELDVYEKIYLDLQEDETEFANEQFRNLYLKLIDALTQQRDKFKIDVFINTVSPEEGALISDIILNEDKYVLHRWDTQEIYVKLKKDTIAQVVSQTVLYLRRFYVSQKIEQLAEVIKVPENSSMEVLMDIKDYQELNKFIALKLNRVV